MLQGTSGSPCSRLETFLPIPDRRACPACWRLRHRVCSAHPAPRNLHGKPRRPWPLSELHTSEFSLRSPAVSCHLPLLAAAGHQFLPTQSFGNLCAASSLLATRSAVALSASPTTRTR